MSALEAYAAHLRREEKSPATVEKYLRYARVYAQFLDGAPPSKESAIAYKHHVGRRYTASGANGMLAAVNSLLSFLGLAHMRVRPFRIQRRLITTSRRELGRPEFERLLRSAQRVGDSRLAMVLQTLLATGIRVSELPFITLDTVEHGRADISLKGKVRTIMLPTRLCKRLKEYARRRNIQKGMIFITRSGRPMDRSNIWRAMKKLCASAGVAASKVFPHSLRHLFARTYYAIVPNLAELADLMGHSDINTTRMYTATSGAEYLKRLDALNLVG